MQVETDKAIEKDYLDLLDISAEFGEEEDNQLFKWVRPLHLDDENGNPDPRSEYLLMVDNNGGDNAD